MVVAITATNVHLLSDALDEPLDLAAELGDAPYRPAGNAAGGREGPVHELR